MEKIKAFLSRQSPYLVGAASLLDFAGEFSRTRPLSVRRVSTPSRPLIVAEDWQQVGEDLQAAAREFARATRG